MNYKTYNEYKITNNLFFNKIPINWSIFKLKHMIATLESGKRKDFEDTKFAFSIGGEHINWNGTLNLTNERYITEEFYNSLSKGKINEKDVLLVKDGATIGKTAFINKLNQKMAVNEHVFILRNNERLIPKLLYYLITSHLGFTQIKLTETGSAQGGISQDIGDKVDFVIPHDLIEQQQIANYLDKKTAKIDATIAKNKQLIDLLEEKRVALINQVVTKGLNPDVPMKDSGVEWIGDIPEHWKIRKFGHLINLITKGATPTSYGFDFQDDGINFIKVESIAKNGEFIPSKFNYISEDCNNFLSRSKMKKGDLLFSIAGALGRVAIVNSEILPANTNQALSIIRINNDELLTKYVFYALKADYSVHQIDDSTVQSAQANLSMESIKEFKILIPPIKEQYNLIEFLNQETSKIDKTISKINENINLLEEYKTSLIHHVVTGKIDVRGEEI